MRFFAPLLLGPMLLAISGDALADPPKRTIVNRVLAVVNEEPITLVELSARAAPYLRKVRELPEKERPAAESQVRRELLQQLIAERAVEHRARELRVSVEPSDVERALVLVAEQAKLTLPQLMAEAEKQGMTEAAYREDIRRQILRGKLVRLDGAWDSKRIGSDEEAMKKLEAAEKAYLETLTRKADVEVLP